MLIFLIKRKIRNTVHRRTLRNKNKESFRSIQKTKNCGKKIKRKEKDIKGVPLESHCSRRTSSLHCFSFLLVCRIKSQSERAPIIQKRKENHNHIIKKNTVNLQFRRRENRETRKRKMKLRYQIKCRKINFYFPRHFLGNQTGN